MRSASACFRFVELPGFAVLHVGGQHDLGGPVPDLIQRAVTLKIEWRPWRVQFLTLQSISDSHTGRGGMREWSRQRPRTGPSECMREMPRQGGRCTPQHRCCCCCTRVRVHGGRAPTQNWRLPKSTRHVLAPGVPRRQLVQDPRGATSERSCLSALHHAAADALPSRGAGGTILVQPWTTHDPRGWTSPLASFFATEGLRENSGRRAAGDGWTETVSMTGSSAECPLSGVDHHSSTATTVTFANGRANDVHLSGSCQAARGSGIRRCSPGRSSYTARGWGTSGSPRTAVAR